MVFLFVRKGYREGIPYMSFTLSIGGVEVGAVIEVQRATVPEYKPLAALMLPQRIECTLVIPPRGSANASREAQFWRKLRRTARRNQRKFERQSKP